MVGQGFTNLSFILVPVKNHLPMTPCPTYLDRVGFLSTLANPFRFKNLIIGFFFLASANTMGSPLGGTESLRSNLYLLNTSNNTTILMDGVLTEYNEAYHDAIMLEDAYKFTNITENLGMTRHGVTLAVERRPIIVSSDTVYFKLWKTTQRVYRLEFVPSNLYHPGMQAVLQDNYLGTNTPVSLTSTTIVDFSVNSAAASSSATRFKIIYSTVAEPSPLPVTFTSVTGLELNNKVKIEWKVENEINIAGYAAEHSSDGRSFTAVGQVSVKGLTNLVNAYSLVHNGPTAGNNFYRIRSNDKDGTIKYSLTVKVVVGNNQARSVSVYPNPVSGNMINLQLANQPVGNYQLKLSNGMGQVVHSSRLAVTSRNVSEAIQIQSKVAPGIYQLEIRKPDGTLETKKLIAQ